MTLAVQQQANTTMSLTSADDQAVFIYTNNRSILLMPLRQHLPFGEDEVGPVLKASMSFRSSSQHHIFNDPMLSEETCRIKRVALARTAGPIRTRAFGALRPRGISVSPSAPTKVETLQAALHRC
ncbi:hypothetical protein J7E49_21915 [Variovorax paradoxus]|nr:hypothetical protein [Variovorax paradoxus]